MSFDEAIKELEGHESNIRFSRLLTMLWNRMKVWSCALASGITLATVLGILSTSGQVGGSVRTLTIDAPSLAGNLLGVSTQQKVVVYLPPSYMTSPSRRYPVVVLLHGVNDDPEIWTRSWRLPERLDQLIAAGKVREMIVVMPNGRANILGSYYANSPVTGRWEDFITQDLVRYIDREFRTIATAEARGIGGHSMGGFGAIRIGMQHPDLFRTIYALSPCCLDFVEDIGPGNQAWVDALGFRSLTDVDAAARRMDLRSFYTIAYVSLAQVISPNPAKPLLADLPVRIVNGEMVPNEPTYSLWREFFPVTDVRKYRANLRALTALAIDYGIDDQFAHIPTAVPQFSRVLGELRVPYVLEVYVGNHTNRVAERLESHVLPFFSKVLIAEEEKRK
jgi:S-formylglutathione hydrolase